MQCDNCGYIFFQPSKKCSCCSAPYVPAQSSFDVGQENLFTIFEMAPGEGGIPGGMGMGMAGAAEGIDEFNFTDDFDSGGAEYGVDENVLDLSDAEAQGFGPGPVSEPMNMDDFDFDTSGMDAMPPQSTADADDFDLGISNDVPDSERASKGTVEPEAGNSVEMDFTGGFDEVEGLGFGFDESTDEETPEVTMDEISLDTDSEPEISLEPELDAGDDQPSLELSDEPSIELSDDLELDMGDNQPALELSEEPSLEIPEDPADTGEFNVVEEDSSMELPEDFNLDEETELMESSAEEYAQMGDVEDDGGIEFDLDSVDLDEPEEDVSHEVPEAKTGGEESFMDLEGLEMESSDDSEDEELKQ